MIQFEQAHPQQFQFQKERLQIRKCPPRLFEFDRDKGPCRQILADHWPVNFHLVLEKIGHLKLIPVWRGQESGSGNHIWGRRRDYSQPLLEEHIHYILRTSSRVRRESWI